MEQAAICTARKADKGGLQACLENDGMACSCILAAPEPPADVIWACILVLTTSSGLVIRAATTLATPAAAHLSLTELSACFMTSSYAFEFSNLPAHIDMLLISWTEVADSWGGQLLVLATDEFCPEGKQICPRTWAASPVYPCFKKHIGQYKRLQACITVLAGSIAGPLLN